MSPIAVTQGSRRHRTYQAVGWVIAAVVVFVLPFWTVSTPSFSLGENTFTFSLGNLTQAIAFIVGVLGLGLLIGFNGQISLGNSFFMGVGAYLTATLVADDGWPYLATLVVVLPATFLLGMLFGLPALRIRGLYLALVTLGLAAVFPAIVRLDGLSDRTGGANGKRIPTDLEPPDWLPLRDIRLGLSEIPGIGRLFGNGRLGGRDVDQVWVYFLLVFLAIVAFWMTRNLIHSRPGRAIVAIRDNETGAVVSGINAPLTKTLTFGTSAALGGLSGTMYAMTVRFVAPDVFGINLAIFLIVGLVVGGVATLSGAVIGGLVIVFVPLWSSQVRSVPGIPEQVLRGPTGTLILGALLVLLTFVMPGGIVHGLRRLRARVLRITPAARPADARTSSGEPVDATLLLEESARDLLDRHDPGAASDLHPDTTPGTSPTTGAATAHSNHEVKEP